jgi:TonB family protein
VDLPERVEAARERHAVKVAVLVALLAGSFVASAQAPRGAADTMQARCDSLLRASVVDSQRVVVRSILARRDGEAFPKSDAGIILQEFGAHLRLPRPMRLPVFSPGPVQMHSLRLLRGEDTTLRVPRLDATFRFTMLRDGSAKRLEVVRPSLIPGLDSAAIASLQQMVAEKLFPFVSDDVVGDSIPFALRLTSGDGGSGVDVPLFASYFPRIPVVDAERREPSPMPTYPDTERAVGAEGDVLFQVVVSSDGTPDLATLEVMHATTRGFAIAAFDAVREMRWTPAHVGACNVPQVVSVPVRFTLRTAHRDSTATPLTSP